MMQNNKYKTKRSNATKQKGATLFTALVFLTLMTIVSVSAAKISMLDVLISGNNQQEMVLYQKAAREIDNLTKPGRLIRLLQHNNGEDNSYLQDWTFEYGENPNNPTVKEVITNRVIEYQCGAINGLATSQGTSNSCRLFDFDVATKRENSSARERHVRGAGKEYPSASRNNFNN